MGFKNNSLRKEKIVDCRFNKQRLKPRGGKKRQLGGGGTKKCDVVGGKGKANQGTCKKTWESRVKEAAVGRLLARGNSNNHDRGDVGD